jgi:DNA-binding NarL/FixJ family response regulator
MQPASSRSGNNIRQIRGIAPGDLSNPERRACHSRVNVLQAGPRTLLDSDRLSITSEGIDMSQPAAIKLVLVESQRLVREAFQHLLEAKGNIVVVGEAGSPQEFFDAVEAHQPDVALVSLDASNERDMVLLRELHEVADRVRTLVLFSDVDPSLQARAIQLGALGIVPKSYSGQHLIKAVEKVHAGELWLDRAQTADVVNRLTNKGIENDPDSPKIASLTPRERQIVALVTEGLKNKGIAERLLISEATARNHLTSILDKLELSNRFQLAVFAFRKGLVTSPQIPAILRAAALRRDPAPEMAVPGHR